MNPYLTKLLGLLNARRARDPSVQSLDRESLIDALWLLSAPYSLEAVSQYCGRFVALAAACPAMIPAQLGDIDARLAILREIAAAGRDHPYFGQSHYPTGSATPLKPYTGDGPMCDVLMLEAHDSADQTAFERITTWFAWLCLRYQHDTLTPERYAKYLNAPETGVVKLNRSRRGERIAAAGCQIRKLADPDQREARQALLSLNLELSDRRGEYLAHLAKSVQGVTKVDNRVIVPWARENGLSEGESRFQVEFMRGHVHNAVRHLLRLIWLPFADAYRTRSERDRLTAEHRNYSSPRVHRYGRLREDVRIHERDGEQIGVMVCVSRLGSRKKVRQRQPRAAWVDEGMDPDEPDDALYQVYVGENSREHITSYYAARGIQYALEYQNALLPWASDRLGITAIAALLASVTPAARDTPAVHGGKLLVLLSLMTGRTLAETRKTRVVAAFSDVERDRAGLVLALAERCLYVCASVPDLSPAEKKRERHVTHVMARYLGVEWPRVVADLLGDARWLDERELNAPDYEHAAKALLVGLPAYYGIRPSSVREALVFVLLEQNRGDLGLVKLITDREGLNFKNLIHYAAYSVDQASQVWARALTRLCGSEIRPRLDVDGSGGVIRYVGTPDAIDKAQLCAELGRLRSRLKVRLAESDPVPGYNLLTLYTLLWVNLATAGRARHTPAPLAIIGDVALVGDKRHADGSADRLVPLTAGAIAQLRAYFAYVWHLSFRVPTLRPIADALATGVINFQFVNRQRKVVGYRPKWLYEYEALIPMPGNWARKLVRQELTNIGGRYLDAGMGHWVMGRHPYRVTSNFAFDRFRDAWLAGEARLEHELGFELIAYPGVATNAVRWPVVTELKAMPHARAAPPEPDAAATAFDLEGECRKADSALYDAICHAEQKDPRAVAALILKIGHRHDAEASVADLVKACCAAARKQWHVPVFCEKPRRQFQRDWLIDAVALHNLAYFQAHALPAFNAELAHLPPPADRDSADTVDIGRFVMLCIWRQGLVTWPVLDAFLQSYRTGGILATGALRYVPTAVRCRRNGAAMTRLSYLEPYCQVYAVTEHARLQAGLEPLFCLNTQQRRARIQAMLETYLRTLRIVPRRGDILTLMLRAAQQYHMVQGAPVLAAYASAEFETHDLSDAEIRHLAGYAPRANHRIGPLGTNTVEGVATDAAPLPNAEVASAYDIVHRMAFRQSSRVTEMERQLRAVKAEGSLERLLQVFARWVLRREIKKTLKGKLIADEKHRFQHIVSVVGYSLLGMSEGGEAATALDEALLADLEEQFHDLHPQGAAEKPFQLLRRFLRQRAGRTAAQKLGLTLGDIEPPEARQVLAKVVTTRCIRRVTQSIGRVLDSGISKVGTRSIAERHLELVGAFGMRRTEAEGLRELDVQGDVIRVQPYGAHTLKTAWSERILPKALADLSGVGWMDGVGSNAGRQLLAHGLREPVNGYNFFDAVNRLVQQHAADPGVHLHVVRHTVASQLLLSLLTDSVDYRGIESELPWLSEFLLPKSKIDVLTGGEGSSGHGLQAIAALLGHSHPVTTLRYYIHTVGIAFYAHLCGMLAPDMVRAFEFRLGSPRTMQRRIRSWRSAIEDMESAAAVAFVHRALLDEAEALCPDVVAKDERRAEGESVTGSKPSDDAVVAQYDADAISYDRIVRVEEIMRGEAPNDLALDVGAIQRSLDAIFAIPSGQRGSHKRRHPHEVDMGRKLPKRPEANSPTRAAAGLCAWLEALRVGDPESLDWLLDHWLHASEQEFGRIRLVPGEQRRWERLPHTITVEPAIERKVFKRKAGSNRLDRIEHYGRLRCGSTDTERRRRDVVSVRWVMTWVCALRSARAHSSDPDCRDRVSASV